VEPKYLRGKHNESSRILEEWARQYARHADGGLGWADGVQFQPDKEGNIGHIRRIDKIIHKVLRPSHRDAIYIEFLSPAKSMREKINIWSPKIRYYRGCSAEADFLVSLGSALAILDAFQPYWHISFEQEKVDANHEYERRKVLRQKRK